MLLRAPWLSRRLSLVAVAAWDVAFTYLSYNITYLIRLGRWEGLSLGLAVITVCWLGTSYLIGRYSPPTNRENRSRLTSLGQTLLAGGVVIGIFIVHSWLYQVVDAQTRFRGFLIPQIAVLCGLSTLSQTLREGLGTTKRKWALVVSSKEEDLITRELESEADHIKSRVVMARSPDLSSILDNESSYAAGVVFGSIGDNGERSTEELLRLREKGGCVVPLLSWCEKELQRIPPELVKAEWLIQAEGFGLRPGSISWRVKRCGDVIGAAILLALTTPLMIFGSLLIWLEDRGPVVYCQTRSGLYGKPIRIWKLRSMNVNAEKAGAIWAAKGDPRITRVGKIIRATRIDELPQLISVLNGDLSLIGPRPERPEIEEVLETVIPNYRVRHWIRPGLSGWAQVCFPYGASTEDSRMKLSFDLYYLRNANIFMDLLIAIKTVRLVIGAKGATPSS